MSLNLEVIDIGALANDGTGDPLRVAFDKINNNFANLSALNSGGSEGSLQFKQGNLYQGSANLVFDTTTNALVIGANIVPATGSNVNIGSTDNAINQLFVKQTGLRIGNITVSETGNTISFPVTVDNTVPASLAGLANITIANTLTAQDAVIGNTTIRSFAISTATNQADQVIYQTSAANVTSGTFKITSVESNSFNSQSVTIVANKRTSGDSATFAAFGTVFNGTPVTRYKVDVGYGNLRVMVSPIPNTVVIHHISFEIEK